MDVFKLNIVILQIYDSENDIIKFTVHFLSSMMSK